MKNIENWSLDDMKVLAPSISWNEFDLILKNHSMDRSMLIKDYIKQLNIEDDIQTGNTNNGIYFKQIMKYILN